MKDEERGRFTPHVISCIIGVGAAILTSAVLLFAVGGIVYSFDDPNRYTTAASVIVIVVSSFIGGFAGGKHKSTVTDGILSGVIFALVLFLLSLFCGGETALGTFPYSILLRVGEIAVAVGGTFLSCRSRGAHRMHGVPKVPKIKTKR